MRVTSTGELAALVRTYRHRRGWTQAELADRAGVSRDWVNRLEGGAPRAEIGKVLDVLSALEVTLNSTDRIHPVDISAIIDAHRSG